jgi:hypothetical protein
MVLLEQNDKSDKVEHWMQCRSSRSLAGKDWWKWLFTVLADIPLFLNNYWNKIKPAICQWKWKVFLCSWICHLPCTRTLLKQRVSTKHEILQSTRHRQTDRHTSHRANIFQQTGGESARKGDRSHIKEGHSGVTNFVTSILKCDTKTW